MNGPMMQKPTLLFCSFDQLSSNSSSAIRNRKLMVELGRYFKLTKFNIISLRNEVANEPFLDTDANLAEDKNQKNGAPRAQRINSTVRSWLKSFIPDRFLLPVLLSKIGTSKIIDGNFNYILTSSDPKSAHLVLLNRHFRRQLRGVNTRIIQYWGDPWFDDITVPRNPISYIFERFMLSQADIIIYNSRSTLKRQKILFPKFAYKMLYLSRGVDESVHTLPDSAKFQIKRLPKILYAGDYVSSIRNIEPLCTAASELGVPFEVIGNGNVSQQSFPEVHFSPRRPALDLQRNFDEADVLFVILNRKGGQIPGKIFDYASVPKPVCVLCEGPVPEELDEMGSRFFVIPNTTEAITKFLLNLISNGSVTVRFDTVKGQTLTTQLDCLLSEMRTMMSSQEKFEDV